MAYLATRHPAGDYRVAVPLTGRTAACLHRCVAGDAPYGHRDGCPAGVRAVALVGAPVAQPDCLAAEGSAAVSPRSCGDQRAVPREQAKTAAHARHLNGLSC